MPALDTTLSRWARASNRRRVIEEVLSGGLWIATAGLLAIGVRRMPHVLSRFGIATPTWLGDGAVGWAIVGVACLGVIGGAWIRVRRRRIDAEVIARRLDQGNATDDLVSTALAVEGGTARGNVGLSAVVASRAQAAIAGFARPIRGLREPGSGLAAVGIAAAIVALLPTSADADDDAPPKVAELADVLEAPPLSAEALAALAEQAERLALLEHKPGLSDAVKDDIAQAREHLEGLAENSDRSLSTLSKAEQALRSATERARDGELFDQQKLAAMSNDELAEHMARAMERGDTDSAAAMADELARRLEDPDDREAGKISRALEKALSRTRPTERASGSPEGPPGEKGDGSDPKSGKGEDPSGPKDPSKGGDRSKESGEAGEKGAPPAGASGREGSPSGGDSESAPSRGEAESRARWRNKAESLTEQLREGASGSARSELEKLSEEMKRSPGSSSTRRSLDRALDQVQRSRAEQLAEMNGEGKGEGEGEGKGKGEGKGDKPGTGPGSPGESGSGEAGGDGDGPPQIGAPLGPSGKPGPGGGKGADNNHGPTKDLPEASLHGSDQVDTLPSGSPSGSVRAIRRFTEGYRDSHDYKQLHDKYRAIAETPSQQEDIPLTRRDYIRDYFQAVRGR